MHSTTIPTSMGALEMHREDGKPESLKLVEKAVPTPDLSEVLIKVAAAPVNPSDLMFLKGLYGIHKKLPVVPGFEGSGTVVATGSSITARFYLGRRVAFVGGEGDGTWAEYAVAPALRCIPLPSHVTLEQGSMMMVNPLSALALIGIAHQGHHRAIINTAAASALGKMLLKLSLRDKLPVIHIVRRPEQVAELRACGAQHILNSTDAQFDTELKSLAHELKATLAFDAVAGELTSRVLSAMPMHSEIIIYGGLSEANITFDLRLLIFEGKRISGFWLVEWMAKYGLLQVGLNTVKVRNLITDELGSEIRTRLPLSEAAQGLADYTANMSAGKILFIPTEAQK